MKVPMSINSKKYCSQKDSITLYTQLTIWFNSILKFIESSNIWPDFSDVAQNQLSDYEARACLAVAAALHWCDRPYETASSFG